jgi:hypothetical protein
MIARTQPLVTAWLATLLVTAAARYLPGAHLDDAQALYLAGVLFTVATWVARRYVTPVARPRGASGEPLVPASAAERSEVDADRERLRLAQERRRGGSPPGDVPASELPPPRGGGSKPRGPG